MKAVTPTQTRGGVRPVIPVRRCPYCGQELELYCQTKKVYSYKSIHLELTRLICRRYACQAQAHRDGWL